ncbi:MAG: hypothetical protein U1F68_14000 [Gammaproteobacteria bacterium]
MKRSADWVAMGRRDLARQSDELQPGVERVVMRDFAADFLRDQLPRTASLALIRRPLPATVGGRICS